MWIHNHNHKLITEVLELSWKGLATKRQIKEYDENNLANDL